VKHLQKEVARLEAELRTPDPSREKDFKIRQVSCRITLILIDFKIIIMQMNPWPLYLIVSRWRWKWRS
jgi:hypothetical protein